jgi:hypothetical protein
MELDDFKTAWQALERRLAEQNALNFTLLKERKVTQAKAQLRPLVIGQTVQLLAGLVMSLLFGSFWVDQLEKPHLLLCGLALHAYGILFIILAGRELYAIHQLDFAAPVVKIQKQLANLRTWRLRVAPIFAVTGAVIWIPLLLVIFAWLGADVWTNDPNVVYWFIASALVSLLLVFGIMGWLRHPSRRRLADALDEGTVGQSIQRAQRTLAELEQFARD